MKYDKENTALLLKLYAEEKTVEELAAFFSAPERSIRAKLSTLGVYRKKVYTTKNGETPVRKDEYIARIAELLDVNQDMLESLEKVNKSVLLLLKTALE